MWNFRLELEYSVSMVSGIRQSDLALHKMLRGSTALFCCDIQERFRPLIHDFPALIHSAKKMVRVCECLLCFTRHLLLHAFHSFAVLKYSACHWS